LETQAHIPLPRRYRQLAASKPASVLLESSRFDEANFRSYLFLHPERVLLPGDDLFGEIDAALAVGCYVAGYFGYECGEGLRALLEKREGGAKRGAERMDALPLAWFGVYRHAYVFDHRAGRFEGDAPEAAGEPALDYDIGDVRLDISEEDYSAKIDAIHEYLRCGDTYQVNFTTKLRFGYSGSPAAIYAALTENQPVSYGALLHGGDWQVLSLSPELFFRVRDGRIVTRPVKGTARRGRDAAEDEAVAQWLHNDPKSRSENVMIVDLLRNDLGRICDYGSVRVDELFTVERYRTLFQMVSEVSGTLRPGTVFAEIFASLFPCGSVTGAPKHRTMEIIEELEETPRGVYTGAIGFFSPQREALFSVPIRTLVLGNGQGEMGVGSGIVIDSRAEEEYRECLLKAEFLTRREEPRIESQNDPQEDAAFQLLESIPWEGAYGPLLPLHLERIEASARCLGFQFDRQAVAAALQEHERSMPAGERCKVRLLAARAGAVTVTHAAAESWPQQGTVLLSECRVASGDGLLRHKTTRRRLYDEQYAMARQQGYDEVLFLNERGEVTEGAISNVLVEKDGRWYTPPVACGLLPGIYRHYLLESGRAEEKILRPEDLAAADAVFVCNAVRGCGRVQLAPASALRQIE